MPTCACYHNFVLEPNGDSGAALSFDADGSGGLLSRVLESSGLIDGVESKFGLLGTIYHLRGIHDRTTLADYLSLLRRVIVADLLPQVDECYALGPYTLFNGTDREYSRFGESVRKAKYGNDQSTVRALSQEMSRFVQHHPQLKSVSAVAAPPKFDIRERNLPLEWAQSVGDLLGVGMVDIRKVVATVPQKDMEGLEVERDIAARVADTMRVVGRLEGDVLIIEDILRSGGTLKEMGRALKQAGARTVYGLCVAKDAKFTNGGVLLNRERWQ